MELRSLLAATEATLFQQAFVVADLTAAQQAFSAVGCHAWATLPAADLDYDYRGARTSCALAIAFARSGDVQIELIQPVRGDGVHVESLRRRGPGFHHSGFLVPDLDAAVAASPYDRIMGGRFGALQFCYLDTFAVAGFYVELVEDPESMMWSLMPWRDARDDVLT